MRMVKFEVIRRNFEEQEEKFDIHQKFNTPIPVFNCKDRRGAAIIDMESVIYWQSTREIFNDKYISCIDYITKDGIEGSCIMVSEPFFRNLWEVINKKDVKDSLEIIN